VLFTILASIRADSREGDMWRVTSFLVLMAWLSTAWSEGTIHRCVGSAGEVVFSQIACGTTAVPFELREAQAVGEGLRASERAWLDQRASEVAEATTEGAPGSVAPSADRDRQLRYRCQRTRQQLDAVRAERRRGYKAGRGAKLRERQSKYETYLDSFCS
jgi:hypothetical protein